MIYNPLLITTLVCSALAFGLAVRRWSADIARTSVDAPGFMDVVGRNITRAQLQRPALTPMLLTIVVIALAALVRVEGARAADVAALQSLASAYASATLTIFTLLAGLTAGFTFTVIATMGSTFTPLLSDPAIRAPRFWWFLAFSMAGMAASVFLLLLPPRSFAELAVTMACLVGSLITLAIYMRGVALDANPATLLRRLTDNDVPPAGFRAFARGRPVQVGLAVVRAALQRRDGPIAAAATFEVVRACAHFQRAILLKPLDELRSPRLTWGTEFISEVQSEFRQWIDELDDNPAAPAAAYDAAAQLIAYPLVWESTLNARLQSERPNGGDQREAEEDLEQPLHALLAASASDADQASAPVALRRMIMKTSGLSGALTTILRCQRDLCEAVATNPSLDAIREPVCSELARAALRLALRHVGQLQTIEPGDRYETRLIQTTQQAAARLAAEVVMAGRRDDVVEASEKIRVAERRGAAAAFIDVLVPALSNGSSPL